MTSRSLIAPADVRLHVAELLERRGWTKRQLADSLGEHMVQSVAYKLASGDWRCLKREHIAALCNALGVTPAELFGQPDSAPAAKRARKAT